MVVVPIEPFQHLIDPGLHFGGRVERRPTDRFADKAFHLGLLEYAIPVAVDRTEEACGRRIGSVHVADFVPVIVVVVGAPPAIVAARRVRRSQLDRTGHNYHGHSRSAFAANRSSIRPPSEAVGRPEFHGFRRRKTCGVGTADAAIG